MNQLIFKNCGAELAEDAWEELTETEDGGVMVDAYPVYVCRNDCEYVERITEFPRIVAQEGEDRLLLLYPNNQGRIFEARDLLLWPSMHIDSLIGRGNWKYYTGNQITPRLLDYQIWNFERNSSN